MHPTADTTNFMLRERLGAAGDAGRWAASMMTYILVRWLHDSAYEPILLFSELDGDCFETRKVEIFRGGRVGLAAAGLEVIGSGLGVVAVPPVAEIAASPEFVPQEISHDEFEAIWRIALRLTGAAA